MLGAKNGDLDFTDKPTSFPGSLFFPTPGVGERERERPRERDPGSGWLHDSRAKFTLREESFVSSILLPHFLCHLQIEPIAIPLHCEFTTMFYSSLQVAITQSRYCNINSKLKQVKCLEAIT